MALINLCLGLCAASCARQTEAPAGFDDPPPPDFTNASVHDPSVFRVANTFYVTGSHLAMAKTTDFMRWEQITTGPQRGNKLVPDAAVEMKEAFEWAQTATFWAGDIHAMPDGRYFMYYCNCEGSKPLGCTGLAVADNPEGPYTNQGLIIKSGMTGKSPDGTNYDATRHPNAVDPQAFFDKDGLFWLVYGSYSGGIFILRLDGETGLPLPDQGYGKKLLGGNHSRIEGPYILYSPETDYYYLFLSFGGLDPEGGYNIRVSRSRNPDGPYEDARGQDMINCRGRGGSFFDDQSIEPYGVKLLGSYQFRHEEGEPGRTTGNLSPGHNSAYYDAAAGRYFLIFHQRFSGGGGTHQIRVHEMYLNRDGWFAVSPFRYDGGPARAFTAGQLAGDYKIIRHGRDINAKAALSETFRLLPNGSIAGGAGSWRLGEDGKTAAITLEGTEYAGRFLRCWDNDNRQWVRAITALSPGGLALWGAEIALPAEGGA